MESKLSIENNQSQKQKKIKQQTKKKVLQKIQEESKPQYFYQNGYRYVKDYQYCYFTYTKQRWIGQNLLNVFQKEFMAFSKEYYKNAIDNKKILVNNQPIDSEYILKSNDFIEHFAIRKEPPIFHSPLTKIYEDEKLIVINKPPSIPVHPCGSYQFNSMIQIMKNDLETNEVYSLHRLDKVTSGLLLFSKSAEFAKYFSTQLKSNNIKKKYLARVLGDFPHEYITIIKPIYCQSQKEGRQSTCSLKEMKEKGGKICKTTFKKVWYESENNTSLIECSLLTGRTHQIRVHLSFLGFSIINDIYYQGKFFGNFFNMASETQKSTQLEDSGEEKIIKKLKTKENSTKLILSQRQIINHKIKDIDQWEDLDIENHVMEIWLHSYIYEFGDKKFQTPEPYWASKQIFI